MSTEAEYTMVQCELLDIQPPASPQGTAIPATLTRPWNLLRTGITTDDFTPTGALIMMCTAALYLIVQVPALVWGPQEQSMALVGSFVCLLTLAGYCAFQASAPLALLCCMMCGRPMFCTGQELLPKDTQPSALPIIIIFQPLSSTCNCAEPVFMVVLQPLNLSCKQAHESFLCVLLPSFLLFGKGYGADSVLCAQAQMFVSPELQKKRIEAARLKYMRMRAIKNLEEQAAPFGSLLTEDGAFPSISAYLWTYLQ